MRICPHCGTTNPANADFCHRCGTDLGELELRDADRDTGEQAADLHGQESEFAPDTPPKANRGERHLVYLPPKQWPCAGKIVF